jgi:IgGFc binding protein
MKRLGLVVVLAVCACGPGARNGAGDDDDDDGSGSGSNCPSMCSADLHSVVDCNGNTVQACDSTQGCANGACVDACDAAAANKSSIGCEYYSVDPDIISEGTGACFAAYVANTWGAPISISVDYNGTSLPIDGFARVPSGAGQSLTYAALPGGMLMPNQVAILFLARFGDVLTDCPSGITPALTATDAATHGTAYGNAFHITTSAPAVMYDIFPYGGGASAATSATLLLPTSVWDVNYVAVDAFRQSQLAGQPFIELVGAMDNTMVTITPTAAIAAGTGVAAAGAGVATQYALSAGQELQFTQDAELNGSVISSNNPVGVWGGASCLNIDVDVAACDSAHQEIPPVKSLGNHYAAVRYRNRFANTAEETVPWRIIGAVDGTTLTYSPSTPSGAPTTLVQGQVAEFDSTGYFVVQSQGSGNPFYMSAHMTGCETTDPEGEDCRGDPEFVNIIPPEQYLSQYTFFTDPTYPETNLVLTREKVNGAFADVTIDCVGTVTGWTMLDSADDMEYTRVDLVTGNFQGVGNCNNGLHVATSPQPFGLVVWGWGSAATTNFVTTAVSYAYPAGASVKQINQVVIQ